LTGRDTGPCPGYVLDHIVALKHGGVDAWWNLQWLGTIEEG
jgi:5-methylcytosine-specific restriction endonuclease McrA